MIHLPLLQKQQLMRLVSSLLQQQQQQQYRQVYQQQIQQLQVRKFFPSFMINNNTANMTKNKNNYNTNEKKCRPIMTTKRTFSSGRPIDNNVAVIWSYNNNNSDNNKTDLIENNNTITTDNSTTAGTCSNNQQNSIHIQLGDIPSNLLSLSSTENIVATINSNITDYETNIVDDQQSTIENETIVDTDRGTTTATTTAVIAQTTTTNINTNDTVTDSSSNNDTNNNKPESVLQYERQIRKSQHTKKVTQILSVTEHLHVVYVDDYIIVINKPSGVLTVPGINQHINSSISSIVHTVYGINTDTGQVLINPAHMIVHRLDMDTSGVLIFGRTLDITKNLQEQFRCRTVHKEYECLVTGHIILPEQIVYNYQHSTSNSIGTDTDTETDSNQQSNDINNKNGTSKDMDQLIQDQKQKEKQIQLVSKHILQKTIIDMPIQRDHVNPPFMRISTPLSEYDAMQTVDQLQLYGWKKLIRKNPKQCQTLISQIIEYGYYNSSTGTCSTDTSTTTSGTYVDDSIENNNDEHQQEHQQEQQYRLPYTRLRLQPLTGRTHQLRVHCASLGYPIVGDPAYGLNGESSTVGGLHNIQQYWKSHRRRCTIVVNDQMQHTIIDSDTDTVTNDKKKRSRIQQQHSEQPQPQQQQSQTQLEPTFDNDSKGINNNIDKCTEYEYIPIERCSISIQEEWIKSYPMNDKPMCLHARILQIQHPITGKVLRWDVPPNF